MAPTTSSVTTSSMRRSIGVAWKQGKVEKPPNIGIGAHQKTRLPLRNPVFHRTTINNPILVERRVIDDGAFV